MSVIIDCNNEKILKLSNSLFGLLHETINEIIDKEKIKSSPKLELLLKKTNQNIYGPGAVYADVAEYLNEKKDVLIFIELIKKAVNLKFNNFNQFENCIQLLQHFQDELMKYAQSLAH